MLNLFKRNVDKRNMTKLFSRIEADKMDRLILIDSVTMNADKKIGEPLKWKLN